MKRVYSVLVLLFICAVPSIAQEKKFSLGQITYEGISQAQVLIEQNRYDEAEKLLHELEDSSKVRKRLDKAYIRFYLGYFFTLREELKKAVVYYEDALSYEELPVQQVMNTYLNLIQIYMDGGEYEKAIVYLDKLISIAKPLKPEYYVYKANAYLALKSYARTIESLDRAIALAKEPKQSWLKVKFYAHYMLEEYSDAIATLKKLIAMEPDSKEYWLQLSSLYSVTKDFSNALSCLDISRIAKLDLNEDESLRLVSWLRYSNTPYKAAQILEAKLTEKVVQPSEKNLERLGDMYYEAKEEEKAIAWYKKAAKVSEKGKLYFKIAQLYANQRDYGSVVENLTLCLQTPDEGRLGEKYLLLAKAHYEQGQIKKAREGFRKALEYKESKKSAQAWLEYLKEKVDHEKYMAHSAYK